MSDSVVLEHAEQVTEKSGDSHFKDLVAWAVDRHAEGHCPAQIFNGMRSSDWSTGDAVAALLQALPRELHEQVRELPRGAPDPDLSTSPSTITIEGHTVQVLCDMRNPRLVVFGNLLSPQECEELMAGATARLERSMVAGDGSDSDVSDVRTSWGMFFGRDETPLCTRLDARIAALLDWPVSHSEEMQVLRYGKAQQYEPHHDYFEPSEGHWASVFRRGGQRVGSMVIYLNTPPLGGSTVFPDIPMEVRAVAGNAVFFAYDTPDASSRTLHGGAPVSDGEKWVAVKWFRQGPFA
jgi:prolyl 4-hydroxylase